MKLIADGDEVFGFCFYFPGAAYGGDQPKLESVVMENGAAWKLNKFDSEMTTMPMRARFAYLGGKNAGSFLRRAGWLETGWQLSGSKGRWGVHKQMLMAVNYQYCIGE